MPLLVSRSALLCSAACLHEHNIRSCTIPSSSPSVSSVHIGTWASPWMVQGSQQLRSLLNSPWTYRQSLWAFRSLHKTAQKACQSLHDTSDSCRMWCCTVAAQKIEKSSETMSSSTRLAQVATKTDMHGKQHTSQSLMSFWHLMKWCGKTGRCFR